MNSKRDREASLQEPVKPRQQRCAYTAYDWLPCTWNYKASSNKNMDYFSQSWNDQKGFYYAKTV